MTKMLDSRWIPVLLAAGWLLLTLGIWGACGEFWWIWPLSLGVGGLTAGGIYAWAAVRQLRAPRPRTAPAEVQTSTRGGASLP